MDGDQISLAARAYEIAGAAIRFYVVHVTVQNPRNSDSSINMIFYKIWRPGAAILSFTSFFVALQVGGAILTLAMIDMPAEDSATRKTDHKDDSADNTPAFPAMGDHDKRTGAPFQLQSGKSKSDILISAMPTIPPLWALYVFDIPAQPFFWPSSVLQLSYYAVISASLLLLDATWDLQSHLARIATFVALSIALAPLHAACTQSVTMKPAPPLLGISRELMRLASFYPILMLPTLVHAGAVALVFLTPYIMVQNMLSTDALHLDLISATKVLAVPILTLAIHLTLYIPTGIALTRIEAALLPSQAQPRMPFSRTAIISDKPETANSAVMVYARALRSIDAQVYRRVVRHNAKWFQNLVVALGMQIS